jgi:hypothetical protein
MQLAAHPPFQRRINHLMLLHARLALEGGGNDIGRIMIAIPGQIADFDRGIGQGFLDEAFNIGGARVLWVSI